MEIPVDIQILIGGLLEEKASLRKDVEALKSHIAVLEEKLSKYEHPKNSSNSSIPPSQDPYRIKRTESLREKSGKHPGGQPGHPGHCLELSSPTETVDHHSVYCSVCGRDLSGVVPEFAGSRREIDIPPVVPVIREHRIYRKQCICGHIQESDYPAGISSPVS